MSAAKITYCKSNNAQCCHLSLEQWKTLDLDSGAGSISLIIGSLEIEIKEVIINNKVRNNEICFSEDLKNQILVPENTVMQVRKIDKRHMEIGPLIGVFVSSKKIVSLSEGKTDSVYERLTIACESLRGLCALFSIGDIDWDKKLIKALLWEKSKWISHIIPLPKVIYDRCFGKYGRKNGMDFRKRLGNGYKVVNAMPKLGKWETIKALSKNLKLLDIIPETVPYHSYKDVEKALSRFTRVYLKPDQLYKGKGVFRVSRYSDDTYIAEHRTKDENEITYLPKLEDLDDLLDHYITIGRGYLIQNEIQKASYKGYPFDFRLLYQKNYQGKWEPSGIAVRMGAQGSIITSPRSGGAVEKFGTILKETFKEDISTKGGLYEKVINIGREIVLAIEKEFGDCVELGLDMTIDINRKIWVIEVNGKPLKVSLKWLNDDVLMNRCYDRPIEYAVYLTGFKSEDLELRGLIT